MSRPLARSSAAVPASAVGLAVLSAAFFTTGWIVGFDDDATEIVFTITWLAGWGLLALAAFLTIGYAVRVGAGITRGQVVAPIDLALLGVAIAVIVLILTMQPLWGTGSGTSA